MPEQIDFDVDLNTYEEDAGSGEFSMEQVDEQPEYQEGEGEGAEEPEYQEGAEEAPQEEDASQEEEFVTEVVEEPVKTQTKPAAKPPQTKPAATTKPPAQKPATAASKPTATAKPPAQKPATPAKPPAQRPATAPASKPTATAKPPAQKPAAQPSATQQPNVKSLITSDSGIIDADPIDESEQEMAAIPGLTLGGIGSKMSRIPIQKFKTTVRKKELIAFISSRVLIVNSHFITDLGGVLCWGGECCVYAGIPSIRYVFPIVVYDTNAVGEIISPKVRVEALVLGETDYETMMSIHSLTIKDRGPESGIHRIDIQVTTSEDQYQKRTYMPAGPATWLRSKTLFTQVKDFYLNNKKNLYLAVARKVTIEAFKNAIGSGSTSLPQQEGMSSLQDLDNAFEGVM